MQTEDKEMIGLKHIIVYYLRHWKLFLGVFIVSIIPAVLYLIYYPRTYEMVSRIKIQDEMDFSSGGGVSLGEAAGMMKSFGLGGGGGAGFILDDELATLMSHDLLTKVVLHLGLNAEYVKPYTWNYRLYDKLPLVMEADSATRINQDETVEFFVKVEKSGKIKVNGKTKVKKESYAFSSLPAVITFGQNTFVLNYGPYYEKGKSLSLYIKMTPAGWIADNLADEITADSYSKTSNVIECFYTDYEKKRGKDLLDAMVLMYNLRADSLKNRESLKSITFLNSRIDEVTRELADTEYAIEEYKKKNQMTDLEYDMQFYVDQMKDLQSRIVEMESQSHAIKLMDTFIKDPANKYSLVPVLMSVQEGEKGGSLSSYNEALVERQKLMQNSKKDNPLLSVMDKQLDQMRKSVYLTIQNAQESLNLVIEDLKGKERALYSRMGRVPTQEREFLEYKRQQEIAQGLYLILLQKREEAMLRLGRDSERAQIIDAAFVKSIPIAPRKLYAALGILVLTLVIPVGFLFVKEQFLSLKEEFAKKK